MRLLELTVQNFRGFGPKTPPIDLSGDLILLYGPNGHGKTSLAEAIEWLFYGTTKRRQRGEVFSRAEYSGTFANAHGQQPTRVDLKVHLDGRDVLLARELGDRETSSTFVDGVRADFSSIGILPVEAHYPVVAQHGLQTFVHSKPKDRRDAICAALGLEELTALKAHLESAKASFQRSPPLSIVSARQRLRELGGELGSIAELKKVADAWMLATPSVDPSADIEALIEAAATLSGEKVSTADEAVVALDRARKMAGKSVFDIDPIAPYTDHAELRQAAKDKLREMISAASAVDDKIATLSAVEAASYSAALFSFWKQGLELAPEGNECPMCDAPTLSTQRRNTLIERLADAHVILEAHDAVSTQVETWDSFVAPVGKAVTALGLRGLDDAERASLQQLLDQHQKLPAFLDAHDKFIATRRSLGQALREFVELGRVTKVRSGKAESLPDLVVERQAARDAVVKAEEEFFCDLDVYHDAWLNIEPAVSAGITENMMVAQVDVVRSALSALSLIKLLGRYDTVLDETQSLIRLVESAVQTKQEALLKSRGQEVKDFYALLNPSAAVGFEGMEPATGSMKLHATSFGKRMPAAANLSECQLNCLGLAVWLMRATTPTSPFGFVLLDDPVQAMDDDHAEAFVAEVVPYLLDKSGKQVIVLSHVRTAIDKLRQLNLNRDTRHYHYENFEVGGPVIVKQLRLQQALADIKGATSGNERNREYAVDRLRVLVEEFVRELYLRKTGSPPPSSYDTASSGPLAELFRVIPDTLPAEHAGMKDTIKFCDPAHHTQVGYSPPLKSNIVPHINRVEGLMKKYGLV